MKSPLTTLSLIAAMISSPAVADDQLIQGLIGGMIGAAIANQGNAQANQGSRQNNGNKRKNNGSSDGISAKKREKNIEAQEALNYFGFDVGEPDGVMGRNSRTAISQLQACIGRPITGELDSFVRQFLKNSYFKAQAGGAETLRTVASKPNGYCGLLQQYHQELFAPAQPAVMAQAAPQPQVAPAEVAPATTVAVVEEPVATANEATNSSTTVVVFDENLQTKYDLLLNQLKLLEQIQKHIALKATDESSARKLATVDQRLNELRSLIQTVEIETEGEYGTPIRPTNANLGVTAAKASEVFPRVPYYVPGTEEIGELWIKPHVTNEGILMYDFNFVAAQSDFDKIKETIEMTSENVRSVSEALVKVTEWSDKALSQGLRRHYEKSAICFPMAMCGKTEAGNNSAEVIFVVYEDGSTAARLQENKGKFRSGYNVSIESGLLLAAYMDYMAEIGEKEFEANTMTDTDLDALFED